MDDEGSLNSLFSEDNVIEIRVGGKYELYFDKDVTNNSRGSEGASVVSYIPNKLLSFTWNMPPSVSLLRNSNATTVVTLEFSEIESKTQIILINSGYLSSPQWNEAYTYFDNAWDFVLDNLVKSCK